MALRVALAASTSMAYWTAQVAPSSIAVVHPSIRQPSPPAEKYTTSKLVRAPRCCQAPVTGSGAKDMPATFSSMSAVSKPARRGPPATAPRGPGGGLCRVHAEFQPRISQDAALVCSGRRGCDRDLSARTAALLRERGEFDPANLGHQLVAASGPLARYYRHPSMLDHAVNAGASREQIGAAHGTRTDQARRDYRE